ncbi:hypothetical protein DPMN_122746 [Dreissena polymorpha]|uniref:Uncharacterized protein n=1 Tax=Dreissena polymorpha TaxID=45954 RepID=A0A9D4GSF8_DREPO|nr:hypothetical protein DPMN_122746 [Dreissena polymorpha]
MIMMIMVIAMVVVVMVVMIMAMMMMVVGMVSVTLELDGFLTATLSRARYPDLPEVPSEEGREQWDSGFTSGEAIWGRPGAGPLIAYDCKGPRDGGTQYAQRTGETLVATRPLGGAIVYLPVHIKVSLATVHWSIWI